MAQVGFSASGVDGSRELNIGEHQARPGETARERDGEVLP
jgi:hypothetical protein